MKEGGEEEREESLLLLFFFFLACYLFVITGSPHVHHHLLEHSNGTLRRRSLQGLNLHHPRWCHQPSYLFSLLMFYHHFIIISFISSSFYYFISILTSCYYYLIISFTLKKWQPRMRRIPRGGDPSLTLDPPPSTSPKLSIDLANYLLLIIINKLLLFHISLLHFLSPPLPSPLLKRKIKGGAIN